MAKQRGGDKASWGFGAILLVAIALLFILLLVLNKPSDGITPMFGYKNEVKGEETFCGNQGCSL